MLIIALLLVVACAGAVFLVLRGNTGAGALAVAQRLGRYGLSTAGSSPSGSQPDVSQLFVPSGRQQSAVTRQVEKVVGRGRYARWAFTKLEQADLKMTPAEFTSICAAVFVMAMLIGLILKGGLGVFLGAIVGLIAPWMYLRFRSNRRKKKFLEQLADMCQMMGNSMRAGFSILQSMDLVGQEGPAPASQEFERVVTEVKLGLPMETALEHLQQRQPGENLELMIVAINVQRQIGGNLSEILMVIAQTIRERVRFERDLKALTAQARYSSYIITALPLAVAFVINLMDTEYESYLYKTTVGNIMIGVSIAMLALGYFFLRRIADIEV
jgi:tight adherence protein B